jgi:TPR repeat protein
VSDQHSNDEAREWFQKAADLGHAEAQYQLGYEFLSEESPESKAMLLAAAQQGHAAACIALCEYEIEFGAGEAEAFKWYRHARALGHPHDASRLGLYEQGWDKVFGSYQTAVDRLGREARRGRPESQQMLAVFHATGITPYPVDVIQAYAWFVVSDTPRSRQMVRRFEGVFDEDELRHAQLLAAEYLDAHGRKPRS